MTHHMNPTHADIVKQQVELFETDFAWLKARHTAEQWQWYKDFIAKSMHAAAHATEKAGEVEEWDEEEKIFAGFPLLYTQGRNACRAQSRRQLDEYFGRNV